MKNTMVIKILKYAELQNNYFMTYNMGGIIFINEIIPEKKIIFFHCWISNS